MPSIGAVRFEGGAVLGLSDIRRRMLDLPKKLANGIVRRSTLKGANVIRDEARRQVRVRTGALKKSIVARTSKFKKKDQYRAYVGIARTAFTLTPEGKLKGRRLKKGEKYKDVGKIIPKNYAHLEHWGTKPHLLRSKVQQLLRGTAGAAMHPGATANPFLEKAYRSKRLEATRVVAEEIRTGLDAELRKMGRAGLPAKSGAA